MRVNIYVLPFWICFGRLILPLHCPGHEEAHRPQTQHRLWCATRNPTRNLHGKEVFTKVWDKVVHPLLQIPNNLNELIDSFNSTEEKHIRAQLVQLLLDTPEMSVVDFIYREWLLLVIPKFLQLCRLRLLDKTDWKEHWYSVHIWGLRSCPYPLNSF